MNLISSIGFSNDSRPIENSLSAEDENMIKLILTGGIYPNIAQIRKVERAESDKTQLADCLTSQGKVFVHPSSVNKHINTDGFLIYHEKTKGEKNNFIRGTTLIDNISLLMFGGDIQVFHANQTVTVDGWIKLKVSTLKINLFQVDSFFYLNQAFARTGVIFKEARKVLNDLLAKKLINPAVNLSDNRLIHLLIKAVTVV